ncbi:hypothetical protein ACFVT1_36390 [Streptomyces sp. NPDC057963]|uniref:hypothetical protein n=1 Tax=Streptomyces sp. NPDC057963 TaxID=3346290 RepID=UPI0036E36C20
MTATPDHHAESQAQHIADLREALQESTRWLAHSAGREAATDPHPGPTFERNRP